MKNECTTNREGGQVITIPPFYLGSSGRDPTQRGGRMTSTAMVHHEEPAVSMEDFWAITSQNLILSKPNRLHVDVFCTGF